MLIIKENSAVIDVIVYQTFVVMICKLTMVIG